MPTRSKAHSAAVLASFGCCSLGAIQSDAARCWCLGTLMWRVNAMERPCSELQGHKLAGILLWRPAAAQSTNIISEGPDQVTWAITGHAGEARTPWLAG